MMYPPPTKEGKLQATRDTNLKRFSCPEKEILAPRNSLIYRYSAITSEHFKAERVDSIIIIMSVFLERFSM